MSNPPRGRGESGGSFEKMAELLKDGSVGVSAFLFYSEGHSFKRVLAKFAIEQVFNRKGAVI
jgi:hypothetical protein